MSARHVAGVRCIGQQDLLICVASIAFAACGEDDDNAFKEDYNTAVKPLSELNEGISSSLSGAAGQSNDAIADQFQKLAD